AQDLADRIHQRIEKKLKGHHGIAIDGDEADLKRIKSDDIPEFVIPIVAITMLTIFGAPVLIVAVILYFGFSKSRMQHRTIRMLAEKGQPIPPALLAPPAPAVRQRSDVRRGVVLTMVGLGLMVWPRTLLFVLTQTFAPSAAKRNFPPGFIVLPTIDFARTRDAGRSASELMRNNGKRSRIHRRSIQV